MDSSTIEQYVLFNNDLLIVIEQHHKKKVIATVIFDKAMKKWPAKASHYLLSSRAQQSIVD
ncbi:hypothetical protein EDI28_21920 [Photobacterium chitinilyticum]|uniref:Uncharacterized protein n=1 Tax=Photobacterium chitinilyticum TaxID=2485123 RepID=A0A444JK66_9GAMM|nr:hypothetical protein EDI28_21920 [Photobacterium chitinilyticum]